ncbi:hypothetical protein D3C71_1965600 [compost metagenome]
MNVPHNPKRIRLIEIVQGQIRDDKRKAPVSKRKTLQHIKPFGLRLGHKSAQLIQGHL